MEDFFEKNVCSLCCNKSKNCMILESNLDEENCFSYRCLNYKKKRKLPKKGEAEIEEYFIEKLIEQRTTPFNRCNKYYSQYISKK